MCPSTPKCAGRSRRSIPASRFDWKSHRIDADAAAGSRALARAAPRSSAPPSRPGRTRRRGRSRRSRDAGDRGPSQDLAAAAEALEPATAESPAATQIEALHLVEDRDDAGDQPAASIGADAAGPAAVSNGVAPGDDAVRQSESSRTEAPPPARWPATRAARADGRRPTAPRTRQPRRRLKYWTNTSESSIDDADSADE